MRASSSIFGSDGYGLSYKELQSTSVRFHATQELLWVISYGVVTVVEMAARPVKRRAQ